MNDSVPIITITNCGELIVNVDVTPILTITDQEIKFNCNTNDYMVGFTIQPE
jgi:hypothetical protein